MPVTQVDSEYVDQLLPEMMGENFVPDEVIYDVEGEQEEEEPTPIPLLSYIPPDRFKELGFGGFIASLAKQLGEHGWSKPVKLGLEHSNVIIIPRAIDSMSGKNITPRDTFGQRLYELIQTLCVPPDKQLDESGHLLTDFERKVRTEVNRTRGALLMFGKTSIAKKLTKSGRDCLMLCSRADELIGHHDVLVHPSDVAGTRIAHDEVCLVGRFPGSIFGAHRVYVTDTIPQGTCWTSCKSTLVHAGEVIAL